MRSATSLSGARSPASSLLPARKVSLVPADNTTGNFTKIVQRIPVKIALDLAETHLIGQVLPGMSARVEVLTDAANREDTQ
jgi:membrane fusion protein (multidrug efflux system)